jgi:DNA-directed RNA polymerase specialized sigma24 family protein
LRVVTTEGDERDHEPQIHSNQRVVDAAIDAAKVLELASEISAEFADILYLHFVEELNFHDIAALMEMPYPTVRTIYYRNKPKVHEYLTSTSRERELRRGSRPIESGVKRVKA